MALAGEQWDAYLPCMNESKSSPQETAESSETPKPAPAPAPMPKEIGGAPGPEPTRYGDWEHKGRCTDF